MLTNLTFKNTAPHVIERKYEAFPDAFVLYPNPEDDRWKGIHKDIIVGYANKIEDGIYETPSFNFEYFIDDYSEHKVISDYSTYMDFNSGSSVQYSINFCRDLFCLYGVADNVEQVKEYFKSAINNPNVNFVISITWINKNDQEDSGGWRWHKWGEYIGTQNPQGEYLYDEPNIEKICVFHGYYVEKK